MVWWIIVSAAAALLIIESRREIRNFVIRRYTVDTRKLPDDMTEIRFVLLTDLHGHVYGRNNDSLLEAIRDAAPDAVFCAGDMITAGDTRSIEVSLSLLGAVAHEYPVFYSFGNHEIRMAGGRQEQAAAFQKYIGALTAAGVVVLNNESSDAVLEGMHFNISGITQPVEAYARLSPDITDTIFFDSVLGKAPSNGYNILLAHNPSDKKSFDEWGADLTVSGHLHGGIIRIFGRGLITPQLRLLSTETTGCIKNGRGHIIISGGLGTHCIPFRLANPPEIVVITLRHPKE